MKKDHYGGDTIVKNPWPEWTPVEGVEGCFAREWTFAFEAALPDELISSDRLGNDDIHVTVRRGASPCELAITATTTSNRWSDAVFVMAFVQLFQQLEAKFGRLKTIQGQARDLWLPFRLTSWQRD